MKLSLSWIFDHIAARWSEQNIAALTLKFNQVTAEIERYEEVSFDFSKFVLGKVSAFAQDKATLHIPEQNKSISLASRSGMKVGSVYVLAQDGASVRYATFKDFGLAKEGALGEFGLDEKKLAGSWRDGLENRDIILEVDNKSITHRPDMWGHRGFAREIAAFLELPLKDKSSFLASHDIALHANSAKASAAMPFTLENKAPEQCLRFSALYFDSIHNAPSDLFMALRLLRVGVAPHDLIVDLTNYAMLDWSQPMHAYDGSKLKGGRLEIRQARNGETVHLLNDSEIKLNPTDVVIADGQGVVCLGGIMGGTHSAISRSTASMVLEAANFQAATIRRSALAHKLRTESSARFEKTLDPNQITDAPLRFLKLASQYGLAFSCAPTIQVLGAPSPERVLEVTHSFLESRAGFKLEVNDVVCPLERLGFKVSHAQGAYTIVVPSYRATKDIAIAEDILEEVVRFYGFNNIKPTLPAFVASGHPNKALFRERKIKQHLAMAGGMIEQQNYGFFDEAFLKKINWEPAPDAPALQNSVSANYTRLLSTLIPMLCKNVAENSVNADVLNFFEMGHVWSRHDNSVLEQKHLAGIFFNKRKAVDFYECKEHLDSLMRLLCLNVTWHKKLDGLASWMHPFQTAELRCGNTIIGTAGKINASFLAQLDVLAESDAFIFELDAQVLCAEPQTIRVMQPLAKYQPVEFDLSFFVPLAVQVGDIERALVAIDPLVRRAYLVDFFEKNDWLDKRSLAFRCELVSHEKTLEKEEIEEVRQKALHVVQSMGATLRS
jgi:phenylalanyl-tRNA synthetase beta chain